MRKASIPSMERMPQVLDEQREESGARMGEGSVYCPITQDGLRIRPDPLREG